ncbi:hypothetical protein F4803DRAFT_542198 [Xylaria telfairii]|nr:hypothetical protein F4803DRAFT_542198 [Xylaria telfairii]
MSRAIHHRPLLLLFCRCRSVVRKPGGVVVVVVASSPCLVTARSSGQKPPYLHCRHYTNSLQTQLQLQLQLQLQMPLQMQMPL